MEGGAAIDGARGESESLGGGGIGVDGSVEQIAPTASPQEVTSAFWCACHGGQRATAEYLLGRGADANSIGYDGLTPIEAARRSGATELAAWLQAH
jgi:ankyrin repeat protein